MSLSKPETKEVISLLTEVLKDKFAKGDMGPLGLEGERGPMGLEGRSPIHISDSQPSDSISEIGDIWYQP